MSDKSTNQASGSTADQFPGLPSFVRQLREWDRSQDTADCFDHWAPQTVTGCPAVDFELGRQHCISALRYSREIGTANFLLYVVMTMRGRPLGDIERGFIGELISPALAGRLPPFVSDDTMQAITCDGVDVEAMRANEAFMAKALRGSRPHRELFYNYVLELIAGGSGEWIGAAIYLLVGAALNGGLH